MRGRAASPRASSPDRQPGRLFPLRCEQQLNRLMADAANRSASGQAGMDPKSANEIIEAKLTQDMMRRGIDRDPMHAATVAHDVVSKQREKFAGQVDKAVVDGNTAALLKLGVSLQALQRGVPLVFR